MESNIIYFKAALPTTVYDIRRAFEVDDSLFHEALPRERAENGTHDPWRRYESAAKKRLEELGVPTYDYTLRGFGIKPDQRIAAYTRNIPETRESREWGLDDTHLTREIYRTSKDGIYVFDDHLINNPTRIDTYMDDFKYARIISELTGANQADLETILAKLKKVDGVPLTEFKE